MVNCPTSNLVILLLLRKSIPGQAWWYIPVISALRRLRQKNGKFKANLSDIGRPYLKKEKQKQANKKVNSYILLHNICENEL
jgi:hypothetical protein